ncbi:hypothetical protein NG895_19845 [Aeoliella sp. ICT_H6.2]|uniref:Uncharacterized protein n=1 Tax=Aeoliella straminimaris TaxID=2954799 RepID=A0A9X2FGQ7_9BACT|nr:hypothetical protein [Aeoliella straminimaris]MCO6046159.1 hypothetical protein [Aeoliella straminimaris]
MTSTRNISEEQSKRIFWVVQTVFSLLLARSLVEYKDCILAPFSEQYYLTTLGLALVYLTALWSWIDYSFSTIVAPYDFGRGKFERVRFLVDLLIVMAYAFLLFSLDQLQADKEANLFDLFLCLSVVFLLYLVSGLLRILKYGRRASRIWIIIGYGVAFFLLAIVYQRFYADSPNRERLNVVFIVIAIGITIGYRLTRMWATHRPKWLAIDVDGVLANQIQNLLPIIKDKHDVELAHEDVKEWDLKVGDTDIAEIIRAEQQHKKYVQTMPVIAQASASVNALISKYKVVIVTARAPVSDSWTKRWLQDNDIPFDDYVNIKEGSKQNIDIDAWILIDDYLGNVEQYLDRSDGKAILFSQPWNQDRAHLQNYVDERRLFVASDWNQVRSLIAEIEKSGG